MNEWSLLGLMALIVKASRVGFEYAHHMSLLFRWRPQNLSMGELGEHQLVIMNVAVFFGKTGAPFHRLCGVPVTCLVQVLCPDQWAVWTFIMRGQ